MPKLTRVGVNEAAEQLDSATPRTVARQAPPSMGFSSKNTGVGCHFLFQGIDLTQGSTRVSHTAGRFFTF